MLTLQPDTTPPSPANILETYTLVSTSYVDVTTPPRLLAHSPVTRLQQCYQHVALRGGDVAPPLPHVTLATPALRGVYALHRGAASPQPHWIFTSVLPMLLPSPQSPVAKGGGSQPVS